MSLNAHELSAGLFVRGLTNLKAQLSKAAASGSDEAALLDARLAAEGRVPGPAGASPNDLHAYTLAAQVHWAAEGALLAIAQLLGGPRAPTTNEARSFADLHRRLDEAIASLRETAQGELEAGLAREIVIEHRRGSMRASGHQFLAAFAIPHFFYHLTCAYSILREQGVQLTMGDFLGNWGTR